MQKSDYIKIWFSPKNETIPGHPKTKNLAYIHLAPLSSKLICSKIILLIAYGNLESMHISNSFLWFTLSDYYCVKDCVNFTSIEVSTLPKTKPAKEITITWYFKDNKKWFTDLYCFVTLSVLKNASFVLTQINKVTLFYFKSFRCWSKKK